VANDIHRQIAEIAAVGRPGRDVHICVADGGI
jgi:hypothetical protein